MIPYCRAYIKEYNSIGEVLLIDFVNQDVTVVIDPLRANQKTYKFSDIIFLNYIQFKDKNGRDIFENDIVYFMEDTYEWEDDYEWDEVNNTTLQKETRVMINWDGDGWKGFAANGKKWDYLPWNKVKVLGNFHTTPELLR